MTDGPWIILAAGFMAGLVFGAWSTLILLNDE